MKKIYQRLPVIKIVLGLSLLFNILTLYFDVIPTLYPKLKERYFAEPSVQNIDSNTENIVFDAALNMLKSSPSSGTMVWEEPRGLTNSLINFRSITTKDEFRKFNYPRAYLLYGISNFLLKERISVRTERFKVLFDELIDSFGTPKFEVNRLDQVPFGSAALNMYKIFGEDKYLLFSHKIYQFVLSSVDTSDNIILYRKGQNKVLNDALGLVTPFLIEYSKAIGNNEPLILATRQMEYFTTYGVDKNTYLPSHAINRENLVKIGSANWGRGIGWYYIAISLLYKETGQFKEEYCNLTNTILRIRNSENLWSQFPGDQDKFDASPTVMFLYGLILCNEASYNKMQLLESLKEYISKDGVILQTSGDTYGTNRYSNTFGKSELSQGVLLLVLSMLE